MGFTTTKLFSEKIMIRKIQGAEQIAHTGYDRYGSSGWYKLSDGRFLMEYSGCPNVRASRDYLSPKKCALEILGTRATGKVVNNRYLIIDEILAKELTGT